MEYFGRTQSAVEKNKYAEAEEKVKLAVLGSYGADGEIDDELLRENLNAIKGIDEQLNIEEVKTKPIEIIVDDYVFRISQNGEVTGEEEKVVKELPENGADTQAGTKVELEEGWKGETKGTTAVYAVSDGKENTIPIPKGFYYVGGTLETGVVISDNSADKNKDAKSSNGDVTSNLVGNQFVWIPCSSTESDGLIEYKKHVYNQLTVDDKKSEQSDIGNSWPTYFYRYKDTWKDTTDVEKNTRSVDKYGGFYVGRYEAGIPENASFFADGNTKKNNDMGEQKNSSSNIPVSKANYPGWNCISQENAIIVSKNMYTDDSQYGVKSYLIDGIAWDTIVTWMEKFNSNITSDSSQYGNYIDSSSITTNDNTIYVHYLRNVAKESTKNKNAWTPALYYKKGRITLGMKQLLENDNRSDFKDYTKYPEDDYTYENYTLIASGGTDKTKVKNIYDMAGNLYEITSEELNNGIRWDGDSETHHVCAARGGSFNIAGKKNDLSGNGCIATRAGHITTSETDFRYGFRVVLYII